VTRIDIGVQTRRILLFGTLRLVACVRRTAIIGAVVTGNQMTFNSLQASTQCTSFDRFFVVRQSILNQVRKALLFRRGDYGRHAPFGRTPDAWRIGRRDRGCAARSGFVGRAMACDSVVRL
jgi:hypothetical protein